MRVIILFLLLNFAGQTFAQEPTQSEPIQADRPDQTETPAIVPAGMLQVETGISYEKTDAGTENSLLPTILWKYGVNESFELRLITEYERTKISDNASDGFAPVLVGFKSRLLTEKGIIPQTSFIGHLQFPNLASANRKASFIAPEFRFVMQHTLSDKVSFSYNLGAEWDGEVPDATFIYTVATGIELTHSLGMFLELYGFTPENDRAAHNFDAGLTYLLSNDFMLDVSGGFGLTDNAPDYFMALGFSFRI